jgi:hypothetical protein
MIILKVKDHLPGKMAQDQKSRSKWFAIDEIEIRS